MRTWLHEFLPMTISTPSGNSCGGINRACAVCFGDPNSAMVKGTNNGIFFLLGIIGFVQVGLGAMFIAFWRRARALRTRRDSMRVINGGFFG